MKLYIYRARGLPPGPHPKNPSMSKVDPPRDGNEVPGPSRTIVGSSKTRCIEIGNWSNGQARLLQTRVHHGTCPLGVCGSGRAADNCASGLVAGLLGTVLRRFCPACLCERTQTRPRDQTHGLPPPRRLRKATILDTGLENMG